MDATDLLGDESHYQINTEHGRIKLLTLIGEMSFDQVWNSRVDAEIDGVTVHFISKENLIENKRQVGRLIDLAEVKELDRIPGGLPLRSPE